MIAFTPLLRVVNHHIALNQLVIGFLLFCSMVPAISECCCWHLLQIYNRRALYQYCSYPHLLQINPLGHRSLKRYSKQASSVENRLSNSASFLGKSSVIINLVITGLLFLGFFTSITDHFVNPVKSSRYFSFGDNQK